jgi:CheY-like chemotaxis protein
MVRAMRQPAYDFTGLRILVVEDEYFIANDMVEVLEGHGAEVVGPSASVSDALELIRKGGPIDGAIVDINLHGELAFPVARELSMCHVPFVFATGNDAGAIPECYQHILRCEKPVDFVKVASALFATPLRS